MRLLLAVLLLSPAAAGARSWQVGPQAALKAPSEAARLVQDGDSVSIAPGEYYDCAVWGASRLTIAGSGPGVVLTDSTCQGKAIFVVTGTGVVVRGVEFARARVADGNGAGIRAEGGTLAVEDSVFRNNEVGILAAGNPAAVLTITGSRFEGNGGCAGGRCMPSLLVGGIGALTVRDSIFTAARGGTLVQSAAARTEIRASRLEDGAEGRSGLLVDAVAPGVVAIEGNALQKGPRSSEPGYAIALRRGGDGAGPVRIAGNTLRNETGGAVTLVLDWSAASPVLEGNALGAGDGLVSSAGVLRNRASLAAHALLDGARAAAGGVRRGLRDLLR